MKLYVFIGICLIVLASCCPLNKDQKPRKKKVKIEKKQEKKKLKIEKKKQVKDNAIDLRKELEKQRKLASNASAKENYSEAMIYGEKALKIAKILKDDEIICWQLNNLGFYKLREFKKRTNYSERISEIDNTKAQNEKKRLKAKAKKDFLLEKETIIEAKSFLTQAENLDKNLNDSNRTKKIQNNVNFVDWIYRLLDL